MKVTIAHLIAVCVVCSCMLLLVSTYSYAQKDTVEFKFIPKYYPEDDAEFIPMPPAEIAYSPKLVFPADSKLQGKQADVWIKVKVNEKGIVKDAQILKSTDEAFNTYAIKYAREFKFKWAAKWPENVQNKTVWLSIPVRYRPPGTPSVQSNKEAIINDLANLASDVYQFRIRPTAMGGGGGSYIGGNGYSMPTNLVSTGNATFTATKGAQSVIFIGTSSQGYGTVTAICDSTGRLGSFTYTGQFH